MIDSLVGDSAAPEEQLFELVKIGEVEQMTDSFISNFIPPFIR